MSDYEDRYVVDAMSIKNSWMLFKVISEFVDGFEALQRCDKGVSVFGSARTKPGEPAYAQAQDLGRLLTEAGYTVVTGGGPGIMEAANKGAAEAGGKSVGLSIQLPNEQGTNEFANVVVDFHYFFIRKVMFIRYAQAYVVMPGGFGTLDEFFEAITLIQTDKIKPFPVILMGSDYWSGLLDWIKAKLRDDLGMISPDDLDLIQVIDDPEEVVKTIKRYVVV